MTSSSSPNSSVPAYIKKQFPDLKILETSPTPLMEINSFITVYQPVAGWKAVQYWWNPDLGGFWEPWQTGSFAYATKKEAIEDAAIWADAERLPLYIS